MNHGSFNNISICSSQAHQKGKMSKLEDNRNIKLMHGIFPHPFYLLHL